MKNLIPYVHTAVVSGLIAALLFTQTAIAQPPAAQSPSAQAAQAAQQPTQANQQTPQQPPAPVERQNPERQDSASQNSSAAPAAPPLSPEAIARQRLLSAHTVYLAKSTHDAGFPAAPDDAYNLVLNDLKNWGHYQVVDSIAQADLVFQLRDAVHANIVDANDPKDPAASDVYYLPSFQLTLADPSTLSPLWSVNTSVPTTVRSRKQPALVAAAAENLVSQLKLLAGDPLTRQDLAAQKQVTHLYHAREGLAIGLGVGFAAAGLATVFIVRHYMEQNQASFCAAHGISPCPGA